MYYTYMLRCTNNSIYTGITTDLKRRMEEHFARDKKCAKYTLNHPVKKLEIAWKSENRVQASKLEYYIKTLPKTQKEELIKKPNKLKQFLADKLDCSVYKIYK